MPGKPRFIAGKGWRRDVDTTRHHRESLWDYKGRGIYHITLSTAERCPVLGELVGDSADKAFVVHSSLGEHVNATFRGLPAFYARKGIMIRILAVRLMPDHLHGVIHVLEPMPVSIGEIVRSFKSACTSWYKREWYLPRLARAKMPEKATTTPAGAAGGAAGGAVKTGDSVLNHFCRVFAATGTIWERMPAGYHERILHCRGQLDNMIRYVKDNPRRLWLKRHNPGLFKMRNNLSWTFVDEDGTSHTWTFRALGNIFLLHRPAKQLIQCSRSITAGQLEHSCSQWLHDAEEGVVSVTAAISDGEKTVARGLLLAGLPMILLLKDGFPQSGSPQERFYKPGGKLFDACSGGTLLLVEPDSQVLEDPLIQTAVYRRSPAAGRSSQRYQFLALNKIGEILVTSQAMDAT